MLLSKNCINKLFLFTHTFVHNAWCFSRPTTAKIKHNPQNFVQHHREAINCLRSCELKPIYVPDTANYLLICEIKLVTIDDADTKYLYHGTMITCFDKTGGMCVVCAMSL